jgi:protein phosphatase PTC2/3
MDSDDTEMFDHDEEDKDLESQVLRGPLSLEQSQSEREETPGPNATHVETSKGKTSDSDELIPQNVEANHYPVNSKDSKMETTAH